MASPTTLLDQGKLPAIAPRLPCGPMLTSSGPMLVRGRLPLRLVRFHIVRPAAALRRVERIDDCGVHDHPLTYVRQVQAHRLQQLRRQSMAFKQVMEVVRIVVSSLALLACRAMCALAIDRPAIAGKARYECVDGRNARVSGQFLRCTWSMGHPESCALVYTLAPNGPGTRVAQKAGRWSRLA